MVMNHGAGKSGTLSNSVPVINLRSLNNDITSDVYLPGGNTLSLFAKGKDYFFVDPQIQELPNSDLDQPRVIRGGTQPIGFSFGRRGESVGDTMHGKLRATVFRSRSHQSHGCTLEATELTKDGAKLATLEVQVSLTEFMLIHTLAAKCHAGWPANRPFDFGAHVYHRVIGSTPPALLGLKDLQYEELDPNDPKSLPGTGKLSTQAEDQINLTRPIMRLYRVPNKSLDLQVFEDNKLSIRVAHMGLTHLAIWRPGPAQSISGAVGRAFTEGDKDQFYCMEPLILNDAGNVHSEQPYIITSKFTPFF